MYRNVFYDSAKQCVHLWTWNDKGKRVKLESSYEPHLYVESAAGTDAISIFNTPLKRVKFKNQFERNRFVNETPIKRLFHNLSCEQDFLLTAFKDNLHTPQALSNPLKVFFLDIETYSPGGMPDPHTAPDPINLITLCDSLTGHYYSWGLKPYTPKEDNITYVFCKKESELLMQFLNFWSNDHPDMITCWNGEGFDVPYIMNRLNNLLGEEESSRMSPVNAIFYRENVALNKFGQMINRWYIRGVSNIDYMEVYKTFARGDRESYSLDSIGEYEEVGRKTDIAGQNLAELSEKDWELFVDYNIQDVKLLVKLDEKLKYIKLIRALSYKGFIPFEQSLGKVSMITGAVAHQALLQNYRIPTFKNDGIRDEYVGGYVHEPERGLSTSVVSYDANSLYPNTIITLNISPETKVGKVLEIVDGEYTLKLANEKTVTLSKEKFDRLVQKEELCISKYNILYTQKFKGVVPNLIDRVYGERITAQNQQNKLEDELYHTTDLEKQKELDAEILNLDTLQNVYKLVLNSIYGVFAQKYSPLFDIDHSASITLTGQAVAKQASEIVYNYATDQGFKGTKKQVYIYGDTDSCYFSVDPVLKQLNISLLENGKISDPARRVIEDIDKHLNQEILKWAQKDLQSSDPRFVFKQEAICDVALFQEKKRYILHIIEQKGKPPRKPFKYVGVEVARSTYSAAVKSLIKSVIENAMLSQDKKKADEIFKKAYEDFCNFSVEDVSIRTKISDYEKYEARIDSFGQLGKATPIGASAGIRYNTLLKKLKVDHVYNPIGSGQKIKYFYAAKNNYNYKVMGFMEKYPLELREVVRPDYQFMFEKVLFPPIERFYDCIGWRVPTPGKEVQTDLFDLFGV